MQSLGTLVLADLTTPLISPLQKLEVFYESLWQEPHEIIGETQTCLISVNTSMAGADPKLSVVAGSWSARIHNPENIFHPLDPTSAGRPDVFVVGTPVRISQGLRRRSAAVDTLHRAVAANIATIGTNGAHGLVAGNMVFVNGMADPAYNGLHTVVAAIDGTHFTFDLTHANEAETVDAGGTTQKVTDHYWEVMRGLISEARYSIGDQSIEISGMDYSQVLADYKLRPLLDLQFGDYVDFVLAAGAELVTNGDFDVNTNGWTTGNWCTLTSVAGGVGGGNCCQIDWLGDNYVQGRQQINGLTVGQLYTFSGYVKSGTSGNEWFRLNVGVIPGASNYARIEDQTTGAWVQWSIDFVAQDTTVHVSFEKMSSIPGNMLFDKISLKAGVQRSYFVGSAATGAWLLRQDLGGGVWGDFYENEDWTFDNATGILTFAPDWTLPAAGTAFRLYFYEAYAPEEILFTLLYNAGLYASYAAAEADAIYTPTGIVIERPAFADGTTGLEAVRLLAERADYIFYFQYDGRPVFIPKPAIKAPGAEDLALLKNQVAKPEHAKNDLEFYNRIKITGETQSHPVSIGEMESAPIVSSASHGNSIASFGEKNLDISNTLWQSQADADASVLAKLADLKDPKDYLRLDLAFCPIPVEWGDTVKVEVRLSSGLDVDTYGLVRDIKVSDFVQTVTLELNPLTVIAGPITLDLDLNPGTRTKRTGLYTGDIGGVEGGSGEAGSMIRTFLDLTDTPATYAGQGAKRLQVNVTESGIEFTNYAQIITVAKSGGEYTTVQAAINSILDATSAKRYLVRVMPGTWAEQITMKSWVDVRGAGKHATRLDFAADAGTVILADYCQIEDVIIEGQAAATNWAIVGTNVSNWHIRNVDILNPLGSTNRSQGIKATGNTWSTGFIEHCVINLYTQTGYGLYITGNAAAPQLCDLTINDINLDTFAATSGGGVYFSAVDDVQIRNSSLRTSAAGFDISVNGNSAIDLQNVFAEFGTSSIEIAAGSTVRAEYVSAPSVSNSGTLSGIISNLAGNMTVTGLTTGYLPYKTATIFGNSPLITDGTSVGLGTSTYDGLFTVLRTTYPVSKFIRSTDVLNDTRSVIALQHRTSGDMADGFGCQFTFDIRDNAGVDNMIAGISAVRDGADNSGKISFDVYKAGVQAKGVMNIDSDGVVLVGVNAQVYNEKLAVVHTDATRAGIHISDQAPTTKTETLYNSGGNLYWPGSLYLTHTVICSDLTAGRIVLSGTGGILQDVPTLLYDSVLNQMIINENAVAGAASLAGTALSIRGVDAGQVRFNVASFGVAGMGAYAQSHARGTAAIPAAVQSGDVLFSIEGWGYGATGYSVAPRAFIRAYAGQTWTDAKQEAYMSFWTTPIDIIVPVRQWTILSNGNLVSGLDGTAAKNITTAGTISAAGLDLTGLTDRYVPYVGVGALANSVIYQASSKIGIGTESPTYKFVVSNAGNAGMEVDPVTPTIAGGVDLLFYDRAISVYKGVTFWASSFYFGLGTVLIGATAPVGAEICRINGDLYGDANCSMLSYTDRSEFYNGDALAELRAIKGVGGKIDHSSLPLFVQASKKRNIYETRPVTRTRQETQKVIKQIPVESVELINGKYTKIVTVTPKEEDEGIFDEFDLYDEAGGIIVDRKGQPVKHRVPVMEEYQDTETVKTGEEDVIERNLGAMISMLTVAVQQLAARIEILENK